MSRALAVALCLAPAAALAGGWVQPEAGWYAKIDNRILVADAGYRAAGGPAVQTGGRYSDWSLSLYGEYGLSPTVTAVVTATPLGWAAFDDQVARAPGVRINSRTAYVGPLGGGLRWGLLRGTINLAVEGRYSWAPPIGDRVVGAGEYDCTTAPCGTFVWQPTVPSHRIDGEAQVGVALPAGLWFSGRIGGRVFAGVDQDPALRVFAQLGWRALDWLSLEAHLDAWLPAGDVVDDALAGSGQTRYVGQGLSASVWIFDDLAVRLGIDGATGVRANAAAPVYGLGVELRR